MQMLAVYRCRRPAAPCNTTPLPSNPCSWLVPAHMACTLPSPAHVAAAAAPLLQAPQGPARPTRSNWCWMRWGSVWSASRTRRWVGEAAQGLHADMDMVLARSCCSCGSALHPSRCWRPPSPARARSMARAVTVTMPVLRCAQWIVYPPNSKPFECVCDADAYAENIRCAAQSAVRCFSAALGFSLLSLLAKPADCR